MWPRPEPKSPAAGADRIELAAAIVFLLAALALALRALGDYSLTWMHPEVFLAEQKHFAGLTGIHWVDLARFFDCQILSDNCTRTRFLTYLAGYADSFFRLWLVQFLPPHPSLTFTWLLSFASLYFFYRALFLLTEDRPAALIATALYVLSAGFLSSLLMLFNPAKALAGFFVNLSLFQALRIARLPRRGAASPAALFLYLLLLLGDFSDETCWFLAIAVPVLLFDWRERRDWPFLAAVFGTFPLFLAFVTWAAPPIMRWLWGYPEFDFWGWAFNVGHAADQGPPLLERLDLRNLLGIAFNIPESEHAWWRSGATVAALSLLAVAAAILAAGITAAPARRALLVRLALLFCLFLLFQSPLLLRHYVGAGTYYYGALTANFSLLLVAAALACVGGRRAARAAALAGAVYLGYVSFSWCMSFNRHWIAVHDGLYASMFGTLYGPLTPGAPLSAAKVEAYWRAAREGGDYLDQRPAFAPKDIWLFNEMDAWRRRKGLAP